MLGAGGRAGPHPGLAQPREALRSSQDEHHPQSGATGVGGATGTAGPGPLRLQHLPRCAEPGTRPRCSGDCPVPEPGTPPSAQGGCRGTGRAPHPGMGQAWGEGGRPRAAQPWGPGGPACLTRRGAHHARPPTQSCGQGAHAAASFPAPKQRRGANPSWDPAETPRGCPSARHKGAAVPWPEHGSRPLPGATSLL